MDHEGEYAPEAVKVLRRDVDLVRQFVEELRLYVLSDARDRHSQVVVPHLEVVVRLVCDGEVRVEVQVLRRDVVVEVLVFGPDLLYPAL